MHPKRLALVVGLLCALLLAACGSPKPSPTVNGHKCSSGDEALQCVLPPAPHQLTLTAPRALAHGVDFAWGAPSVGRMHELGAAFGACYFSHDSSKGCAQRAGLVSSFHAAGISTVGVWETTANRAAQGCAAGRADAIEAARQARAVGNTNRPIDFAIDFDATGPQVDSYFSCAHAQLGQRDEAYGGYRPLKYLCEHHLVGHANWQTYAWSDGLWLPASCAPLEQYLNGSSVDYDRAIAADYGQWPGPQIEPTPAQKRAAKQRALAAFRKERAELHGDIERHRCRPGQHNLPREPEHKRLSYHRLCGRWIKRGGEVIAKANVLERELSARSLAAAVPSLVDRLSPDHTSIEVSSFPSGTTSVKVAVMKDLAGTGVTYPSALTQISQLPYKPPAGYPVVDMLALSAKDAAIGGWAGRKQTTPVKPPEPAPEPKPLGLQTGLVTNGDNVVPASLKPKVVRLEFSIDTPPATVVRTAQMLAARGILLQPLAGFSGRIPTAAEAKALGAWAIALKGLVKLIEFGNETNYQIANTSANGRLYAGRSKEAVEAMAGTGVGLLVQASDAGAKNTLWVDGEFEAVPNLASLVAGWTIHPYWGGPNAKSPDSFGGPMMVRLIAALEKHGDFKDPIYATEWGEPTDNGVEFTSGQKATFAETAQIIERDPYELQADAKGRLAQLDYYQAFDQRPHGAGTEREWFFGALTNTGERKGVVTTAVEAFLASSH